MIKHPHCGGTHETADEARACQFEGTARPSPMTQEPDPVRAAIEARKNEPTPASEKQIGFLRSLADEREWDGLNGQDWNTAENVLQERFVSKAEASSAISALLNQPKVEGPRPGDPDEGIYFVDGTYFKVQVAVHGSGRKYAKRFNAETGEWVYEGSGFAGLNDETKVTPEKAAEFGHLYGMCVRCGRTLTDEDSIAAGIGPICAGKI